MKFTGATCAPLVYVQKCLMGLPGPASSNKVTMHVELHASLAFQIVEAVHVRHSFDAALPFVVFDM